MFVPRIQKTRPGSNQTENACLVAAQICFFFFGTTVLVFMPLPWGGVFVVMGVYKWCLCSRELTCHGAANDIHVTAFSGEAWWLKRKHTRTHTSTNIHTDPGTHPPPHPPPPLPLLLPLFLPLSHLHRQTHHDSIITSQHAGGPK